MSFFKIKAKPHQDLQRLIALMFFHFLSSAKLDSLTHFNSILFRAKISFHFVAFVYRVLAAQKGQAALAPHE